MTKDLLIVTEKKRLDKLLTEHFPEHSRTYFQYLIEEGLVLVNGEQWKKREMPKIGDEVEIFFTLTPEIKLEPENIPLDILYEDEHLLAINKPAGMVVHPAPGHYTKTFVHALLYHCKGLKNEFSDLRPGIVHRLDKDTSGVLLAAKTREAHQKLISLFCKRKIEKKYIAICFNKPIDGLISAPIARHPTKRKKMCIDPEKGKEAISLIKVLDHSEKLSLVEITLITGRTHQIRVHLKHLKCPILGDPVYGAGNGPLMLHAHKIIFIHPLTQKVIEIEAPIPFDFQKISAF